MKIVHKTIGYELRAADPIPFDAEYTRNLGYSAVNYLLKGGSGALIAFYEGKMKPIPLRKIIDPETGKTRVRYVDTRAEPYIVGRQYMIRLAKEDLKGKRLTTIASTAHMKPAEFRGRYAYIAK